MELPFTIVFEPPSQTELRALLRMRGHWAAGLIVALTIGTAYVIANLAQADALAATSGVPLALSSQPVGASVWIDGHQRGSTPLQVGVEPGVHRVVLKAGQMLDGEYEIDVGADGSSFGAVLWRQKPRITRLRPALPGATLADVRALDDGEFGLSLALPPGRDLQAWRLDPKTGAVTAVMDGGMAGTRLEFAGDGQHLAYLGSEIGPPRDTAATNTSNAPAASVLWLLDLQPGSPTPSVGWRAPLEAGERLVDASWDPAGDRLLVVAHEDLADGAAHSRAWLVTPSTQAAESVLSIPSDVVPGTLGWSPDNQHVAFVAHAGQVNALCLLGVDGQFRYVADLDPGPVPLGVPAASWAPDGQRLLFVAPHQHVPGVAFDWLSPDAQHAVYVAELAQATPLGLFDTSADQVAWREDGGILGLWRAGADSPLSIRLLNGSSASGQKLLDLPLRPTEDYAALWDLARANLLVASRDPAGGSDFWLAQLGLEGDR